MTAHTAKMKAFCTAACVLAAGSALAAAQQAPAAAAASAPTEQANLLTSKSVTLQNDAQDNVAGDNTGAIPPSSSGKWPGSAQTFNINMKTLVLSSSSDPTDGNLAPMVLDGFGGAPYTTLASLPDLAQPDYYAVVVAREADPAELASLRGYCAKYGARIVYLNAQVYAHTYLYVRNVCRHRAIDRSVICSLNPRRFRGRRAVRGRREQTRPRTDCRTRRSPVINTPVSAKFYGDIHIHRKKPT